MTLLSTTTLSGTSTTISSIDQTYNYLFISLDNVTNGSSGGFARFAFNAVTTDHFNGVKEGNGTAWVNSGASYCTPFGTNTPNASYLLSGTLEITQYTSTTFSKPYFAFGATYAGGVGPGPTFVTGLWDRAAALTSLVFTYSNGGTLSGTIRIYGVK